MRYPYTYLSPGEVDAAQHLSEKALDHYKNSDNYTGLHCPDRFFVGFCGEIAFDKYCMAMNIPAKATPPPGGTGADKQDFIVNGWTIDVKNTHNPKSTRIMVNADQVDRHPVKDVYIGCKGEQVDLPLGKTWKITLYGAIPGQQLIDKRNLMEFATPVYAWELGALPIKMDRLKEYLARTMPDPFEITKQDWSDSADRYWKRNPL